MLDTLPSPGAKAGNQNKAGIGAITDEPGTSRAVGKPEPYTWPAATDCPAIPSVIGRRVTLPTTAYALAHSATHSELGHSPCLT
jgi:hypothetical protein